MDAITTIKIIKQIPNDINILLISKEHFDCAHLVKKCAEDMDINFCSVNLSKCDNSITKLESGLHDINSLGILFFSDFNRVSNEQSNLIFEICIKRSINGRSLASGCRIIAEIKSYDNLDPSFLDKWFVIFIEGNPAT